MVSLVPSTAFRVNGVTNRVFDYDGYRRFGPKNSAKIPKVFNSPVDDIFQWQAAEKFLPATHTDAQPVSSIKAAPGPQPISKKMKRDNLPPPIKTKFNDRVPTPRLGTQKAGWGKPVPLLGLTKEQAIKVKSNMVSKGVTKKTVDKMTAFRNKTVQSSAVPGRYFSDQAAWIAAAVANQELKQFRLDPYSSNWDIVDQVGSIVSTGLSYVNPILGMVAGPAIEGIAQLATQAAKNNVFEGSMGLGSNENIADFKRYAKFMEENPDLAITQDEWKAYDDKLQEYEGKGSSCKKTTITPEMLGDQTLEEFMEENGVKKAIAPEKPKSRGSARAPTQEEIDALKNARIQ